MPQMALHQAYNRKPFIEMNGLFCSTFCLCKKNEMQLLQLLQLLIQDNR